MNKLIKYSIIFLVACIPFAISCSKLEPKPPQAEDVMDAPLEGLTPAQYKLFTEGAEEFDEIYTSETGLGPIYVATSCGSCHAGDNRGHLATMLTRFGQTDSTGNYFLEQGGPQLQQFAILGHGPEQLPSGASSSKFIAPIVSGVGFLELVPDADILAMASANATNSDGVRGHPNWNTIPNYIHPNSNAISQQGKYICRFGRKASTYNLQQQTAQAFNQDMGLTTSFITQNPVNYLEGLSSSPTSDIEITDRSFNANLFYLQVLQAPFQRNTDDEQVVHGKQLFNSLGCETCHRESLKTGFSPIESLSYKEFHPFTDLLVHDMGSLLDDGYTEGSAKTSEWRTTPLWGLGLTSQAQGGDIFLLHDGRARTIEDAILFHGGESEKSKQRFQNLSQQNKQDLLSFLNSL